MSKRYDEVMEKIEVTDVMRQRILANLDKLELDSAHPSKTIRFPSVKRLMPIAACLLLLLAGVFSARHFLPEETADPGPSGGSVMVGSGIVEAADAGALSEVVGFPVKEVTALPFQTEEVSYLSFWGELAQVTYTGEGRTVTFRQCVGDGDNSGDYNEYAETEVREMSGLRVTLKGDGQSYCLAVWDDGTYAYSISAEPGLTLSEWEAVIAGM